MISFIISLVILLAKVYNVLSVCEWYDIRMAFILFISYMITWLVGLVSVLMDYNTQILVTLFKLQTWLIIVNVIILLIELFLLLKFASTTEVKPYMSNQNEYRR